MKLGLVIGRILLQRLTSLHGFRREFSVIAGLCQSNPIDIVKRTAPGMILGVITPLIFF